MSELTEAVRDVVLQFARALGHDPNTVRHIVIDADSRTVLVTVRDLSSREETVLLPRRF